jgi:SAM-dependent methyltransferase
VSEQPNELASNATFEFAALEGAHNYRAALVREFSPFLTGRVLEIGAGIGQFTSSIAKIPAVAELGAVEPDLRFWTSFKQRNPGISVVESSTEAKKIQTHWDTVVCINVLEHIQHDRKELELFHDLLAERKGSLCLFVPARPEIYSPIDRDFGHYRRYTMLALRNLLQETGFQVVHLHYFNFIGYFGWWWQFRVLKKRQFDPRSVLFFDRILLPAMHAFETRISRPPVGQSLLAISRAVKRD